MVGSSSIMRIVGTRGIAGDTRVLSWAARLASGVSCGSLLLDEWKDATKCIITLSSWEIHVYTHCAQCAASWKRKAIDLTHREMVSPSIGDDDSIIH